MMNIIFHYLILELSLQHFLKEFQNAEQIFAYMYFEGVLDKLQNNSK